MKRGNVLDGRLYLGRQMALTIFAVAQLISSFAFARSAGGGSTGGGDWCEPKVQHIQAQIKEWIMNGGPVIRKLPVPNGNVLDYQTRMLEQLNKPLLVECTREHEGEEVKVEDITKVCKFEEQVTQIKIKCDARFMSAEDNDQYFMIHHEYAAAAKLEAPEGPRSSYVISNHVSKNVEMVLVSRLRMDLSEAKTGYSVYHHRFSIEGKAAQKVYEAIENDRRAKTDDDGGPWTIREYGNGVECKSGPKSCVTFTGDGDRKPLRNSEATYQALKEAGVNMSLYLVDFECGKKTVEQSIDYSCKFVAVMGKD